LRGQQLTRLISQLRAELGRSTNVSVGVDDAQILIHTLQRTQETLYDDFDWPHLRYDTGSITLQAGQRYYDIPDNLNYDRIESAWVRLNGLPIPFRRGIDPNCYAAFDSEADVRASPAQRWDIRSVDDKEQIEVWPIPNDSSNAMQFIGIRNLRPLVDGSDVTDLDDRLIVLFAAADLLEKQEAGSGRLKLSQAQQLYSRLKGRSAAARPTYRMGMGVPSPKPYRATVVIGGH
jgi:hypothetical protein